MSESKSLIRYEAARKALSEARNVDEVKDIADKAVAIQAYARQAKDRQMEIDAAEIRIRAERRLGEMLKEMPKATGGTHGGRPTKLGTKTEPSFDAPPTLSDIGIGKKLSARSQKLAEIPKPEFDAKLKTWRDDADENNVRLGSETFKASYVREARREEVKSHLESVAAQHTKELSGVFDVIVIDPPWPMQKIERDVRPNQSEFDYPTMSEDQLTSLSIPAADDCHVWLWTTHRFLPMALRLLDVWELKYVCTFVWHKPGGFQPVGLPQYNCEFALYARKGSPMFVDTKSFPVCFQAPRGQHSEKPEEFYEVLRRVTAGRRLDMFGRRPIDGFQPWGKEARENTSENI